MTMILKNTIPAFRELRKGKVWCFVVVSNEYRTPAWALGIATLGESGYTALSPKYGASDDYGELAKIAEDINTRLLGLDSATQMAIQGDTMRRQNHRRDMEEGIIHLNVKKDELEFLQRLVEEDIGCYTASEQFEPLLDRIGDTLSNLELQEG